MKFPSLLQDYFKISAENFPGKIAVAAGNNSITYSELEEQSDRIAFDFLKSGLKRGDRVIIFLDNSIESVISFYGVLKAGGTFVPLSSSVKAEKLAFIIRDSGANFIITDSLRLEEIKKVSEKVAEKFKVILINASGNELNFSGNIKQWSEIINAVENTSDILSIAREKIIDDDLAAIIYTSGSTGEPKGIMCPHSSIISVAKSISEYLDNSSDDRILNVLPISFGYGLYQVLVSLLVGSTIFLEKSFLFPVKILQEIQNKKITGFAFVPTIAAMLLNIESLNQYDFSSLRYLTNAGGPLSVDHLQRLKSIFKSTKIFSMYGLTECQRVSYLADEDISKKPGSVGKPIPNVEIKIVDNDGNEVSSGIVGELIVRGSNVMRGYWNSPELTEKVFRKTGKLGERFLFTGDLFHKDEEGFLYFHGRKDDLIKTKGERVSPKEIENILYKIEDIIEAVVIGVPDEIFGNVLEAVVVKKKDSSLSEKDIQKFCAERLESFMVPKYVTFINELPKSENGKVNRRAVKELKSQQFLQIK